MKDTIHKSLMLERPIHNRSLRGRFRNLACHAGSSLSRTKPLFMYNFFAGSLSTATWTYRSLIPENSLPKSLYILMQRMLQIKVRVPKKMRHKIQYHILKVITKQEAKRTCPGNFKSTNFRIEDTGTRKHNIRAKEDKLQSQYPWAVTSYWPHYSKLITNYI